MQITKKLLSVSLAIILLLVAFPISQYLPNAITASEVSDVVEFSGHRYKLFESGMNWYDAKAACEELGGHLLTINSKEENDFITGILEESATRYSYWTAITYDYESAVWKHYDNSLVEYQNWAENEPNDLQSQNEAFVALTGRDFISGAGTNSYNRYTGEWHWCSSEGVTDNNIGYPVSNFGYICEWDENIGSEENSDSIPKDYDFNFDRWKFDNINEIIELDYYVGMFGEAKGTELYNYIGEKSKHGHCFGMAVSTAATLINAPYVTDYVSWIGVPYTELSLVNEGTMNLDMNISAKDYIKYCHIYQNSVYVCRQRNDPSHSGIANVYNAVKSAAQNSTNSTMIVIDLFGGSGGHTVYAIGVSGSDILVNDSNVENSIQRIKINGNEWTYSAAGLHWDSTAGATINYVENCIEPYMRLVWNIDVEGGKVPDANNSSSTYTEESELNGTNSYYSAYIEPIDTDKLFIVSEEDSFSFSESENMYKLVFSDGENTVNEDGLYWLDIGDSITAQNISNQPSVLKLVGEKSKITTELPSDTISNMRISDNDECEVFLETDIAENVVITFTTYGEDSYETTIYGFSDDTEVSAKKMTEGISISGLNDVTVKYETDKETFETKIKVNDGSAINITVNEEKNTIETDWECKHTDENEDNLCDNCDEMIKQHIASECDHICHSKNEFWQFVWKIYNFLMKLFSMERVCSCGVYHY